MPRTDTADRLLDVAELLVQQRGYNAFSYRDLASEVGVKTASIHYHFPAKADLARALLTRYVARLESALAEIDATSRTARSRLDKFVGLYRETAAPGDRICLCGSMAADISTLPADVQAQIRDYLERSARWVAGVLRDGARAGEFDPAVRERTLASSLVSGLQGAELRSDLHDRLRVLAEGVEQRDAFTGRYRVSDLRLDTGDPTGVRSRETILVSGPRAALGRHRDGEGILYDLGHVDDDGRRSQREGDDQDGYGHEGCNADLHGPTPVS